MTKEEFIIIEGKGTTYVVYNTGKVFSTHSNTWKKETITGKGYYTVYLSGNNVRVHRLIAELFIPIPKQLQGISNKDLEVHHIDGDRSNNSVDNLMWVTKQQHKDIHNDPENPRYQFSEEVRKKMSLAKIGNKNPTPFTGKCVKRIDPKMFRPSKKYKSISEASRENNVSPTSIGKVLHGERLTAGGWIWEYC